MSSRSLKTLVAGLLAASSIACIGTARADTIDLFYHMPRVGVALSYLGMGYADADGNFQSLAGQQILSAHLEFTWTPGPGVDVSSLHMDMGVPVDGAQSQFFAVEGSQLVETSPGTWHYAITTDMYNGTIFDGRFGIESYGETPDGGIALPGTLSADTGYYFTVSSPVPEPMSVTLMLAGLGVVPLVAKRRKAAATA